jgi:hypothetical protein
MSRGVDRDGGYGLYGIAVLWVCSLDNMAGNYKGYQFVPEQLLTFPYLSVK